MRASLAAMAALLAASPAHAADPSPYHLAAPMLATRINKTGKTLTLPATVKEDGVALGEVTITIAPDDTVAVDRQTLLAILAPRVTPEIHARVAAIAMPAAFIPIAALANMPGTSITFDRYAMELNVQAKASALQAADIDIVKTPPRPPGQPPAAASAYVNITTMLDQSWGGVGTGSTTGLNFDYEGAARFFGTVLESEGSLDGPLDSFLCPTGAQCSYAHQNGFKRRATRLVTDFPEDNTRLMLGDVTYSGTSLQRGGDFLGVAVKHDPKSIGRSKAAATVSTLQLDSPADVDVIINGQQTQRLRLRAGTYNLRNLPLGAGTNDIELVITSTTGEQRTIHVAAVNTGSLLAAQTSEWSIAGGYAAFQADGQRSYLTDQPGAGARYRYGFTNGITGELHAQADALIAMTGATVTAGGPLGLWSFGMAASTLVPDPMAALDYAATLSWQYIPPAKPGDYRHALRASAEYRGFNFHTPGESLLGYGGVLYPSYAPALRLDAAWSLSMSGGMSTSLTGRYLLPNSTSLVPGTLQFTAPMWGADLSFTAPLTETLTATTWIGYGNSGLLNILADDFAPEFLVGLRLNYHPSQDTEIQIGADTSLANADLYATHRANTSTGQWASTVSVAQTPGYGALMNTSLSNRNAYGATSLNHSAQFDALSMGDLTSPTNMRTSLRTTSSVAYADGHVAVGAPIRDAFAIVAPHESLPDSTVIVGQLDHPTATGSRNLPALITTLSSGSDVTLPLDATGIPPGYSLGNSTLTLSPKYKAGYAVEVGSANALSAFGTLLLPNGKPLVLTAATATNGANTIQLFTNSRGRFAVEGLSPGAWRISAGTARGPLEYAFDVTPGPTALTKTGPLYPTNRKREHDPALFMDADAAGPWVPVVARGMPWGGTNAPNLHEPDNGGWIVHTR